MLLPKELQHSTAWSEACGDLLRTGSVGLCALDESLVSLVLSSETSGSNGRLEKPCALVSIRLSSSSFFFETWKLAGSENLEIAESLDNCKSGWQRLRGVQLGASVRFGLARKGSAGRKICERSNAGSSESRTSYW